MKTISKLIAVLTLAGWVGSASAMPIAVTATPSCDSTVTPTKMPNCKVDIQQSINLVSDSFEFDITLEDNQFITLLSGVVFGTNEWAGLNWEYSFSYNNPLVQTVRWALTDDLGQEIPGTIDTRVLDENFDGWATNQILNFPVTFYGVNLQLDFSEPVTFNALYFLNYRPVEGIVGGIPLPATLALFALGLAGLMARRIRA